MIIKDNDKVVPLKELEVGEVFVCGNIAYMCVEGNVEEIEGYRMVVNLAMGNVGRMDENTSVVYCGWATLTLRPDGRT